jgi:hypothetical protein
MFRINDLRAVDERLSHTPSRFASETTNMCGFSDLRSRIRLLARIVQDPSIQLREYAPSALGATRRAACGLDGG